jgi:hypothetical protein
MTTSERELMTHLVSHVRRNVVAYLALMLAVGGGGGYAFAASRTKTITVCADKRTGVLHLHNRGRCKRGQTRVTWNKQGIQGPQGKPGQAGQPGAPAVSVWAIVTNSGTPLVSHGLSVQHVSAGTYQLTVTADSCSRGSNAPVVSVSDANPPNMQGPGAFPLAWVGDTGPNDQFTVYTGVVVGGSFTPTDHTFNVVDACS